MCRCSIRGAANLFKMTVGIEPFGVSRGEMARIWRRMVRNAAHGPNGEPPLREEEGTEVVNFCRTSIQ